MDFSTVTDVGLNPSAMVGVRYAAVAVITGNWSPALHRTEDSTRRRRLAAAHPVRNTRSNNRTNFRR